MCQSRRVIPKRFEPWHNHLEMPNDSSALLLVDHLCFGVVKLHRYKTIVSDSFVADFCFALALCVGVDSCRVNHKGDCLLDLVAT
jgi:hypothetical protein